MAKPKIEPPNFAKPRAMPAAVSYQSKVADNDEAISGNLLLIVVVVLVLLGLLSVFIF